MKQAINGRIIDVPDVELLCPGQGDDLLAGVPNQCRAPLKSVLALAPIIGLSMSDQDDPSTWQIQFSPVATEEEREEAQSLIASAVISKPPPDVEDASPITVEEVLEWCADQLKLPVEVAREEILNARTV